MYVIKKMMWNNLLDIIEEYHHIYIYGYAAPGKWLAAQLLHTGKIRNFIDSDSKVSGQSYDGVVVKSYDETFKELESKEKHESSILINTVFAIQDVWEKAEKLNITRQIALGIYLEGHNPHPIANQSEEFIRYSLKCVNLAHVYYFSNNDLFLRSVDLMVTERCSMKCKDCSNLMQYYEKPTNIKFEILKRDIDQLLSNIDHLFEIRLIGGEPFVHNDIYKIMEYTTNLNKISFVSLYTNATIPLKETSLTCHKINLDRLIFIITNYGPEFSRNLDHNIKLLEKLKIPYKADPPTGWTDSGQIVHIDRTEAEVTELFKNCCGKNLLTISDNKLYRCPFAANADRLSGIPSDPDNYVELTEGQSKLEEYTGHISYIPACRYCMGRSWDSPEITPAIQTQKSIDYEKFSRLK